MARVEDLMPREPYPRTEGRARPLSPAPAGAWLRGPFAIWMRNPALADAADKLAPRMRKGKLDVRLSN